MPRPARTSKLRTPRLLIRSSSIHAAGCYTLDPIPRGRRVLEYDGARIPKALADDLYSGRPVTYLFGFGGSTDVIDGFGTAMFLNHSCAPNCETEEKDGRIYIRSIRDIAANEELVYEYNLYDSDDDDADCFCGAPHCRGTMFSDDEVKRRARKATLAARKQPRARTKNDPAHSFSICPLHRPNLCHPGPPQLCRPAPPHPCAAHPCAAPIPVPPTCAAHPCHLDRSITLL